MWNNDEHGIVFKSHEIKLYADGHHTWAMKLSQLSKQAGTVRIITYTIPKIEYAIEQLKRRPNNIYLISHSKDEDKLIKLKQIFPDINFATNNAVHSKVCLIYPKTVYIGSANFGLSGWHETEIGIRSEIVHNWYVKNSFIPLWDASKKIE